MTSVHDRSTIGPLQGRITGSGLVRLSAAGIIVNDQALLRWSIADGRRLIGTVALCLPLVRRSGTAVPADSDRKGEVVESDAEPVTAGNFGGDLVRAAAQVLHEGMSCGEEHERQA